MKEKLLILDDELLILKSLENLLEDEYQVFTTPDAETALGLAREHDIAVILCDERMPKVAGHEVFRRVPEISNATRIMMSGYADLGALTEAVNSGQIFSYVAKPWEPLKLKAQVNAATVHFKLIQEVEQGRGLLHALMENSPDLIYFKDCRSRFTRVNQAHARNLGAKNPAECIGKSNADYFESGDALRWRQCDEEIVRSGQPQVDRIEQINNPRERLGWWSTTQVPMFDRSGQVSGIAGISRNITALKNSEELLREQNARNRMILATAYDAFISMDPDGTITGWNPQGGVNPHFSWTLSFSGKRGSVDLYAEARLNLPHSPATCEKSGLTFGWTAAEAIGRTLCDTIVAPAYRSAHANGVEQFLTSARGSLFNRPIDLIALHRDGHEFPVEATIWPIRVGGALSFNAFARDITDRLLAEEARRKEATLVELLQSVTVAANRSSSIEHTARTCLHLICSYTGWAICHAHLRSAHAGDGRNCAEIWHMDDDVRFAAFREVTGGSSMVTGNGLPGCILASGKPQWIVNLADEEPLSERTRAALEAGLRSGFGFPIVVDDKIIGVLEFFSLQTVQADEELLDAMGHIGSQLGQVIIRQPRRGRSSAG